MPTTRLWPREQQVLGLVLDGKSDKEIAAELGISFNTVRVYVRNIRDKLGMEGLTSRQWVKVARAYGRQEGKAMQG